MRLGFQAPLWRSDFVERLPLWGLKVAAPDTAAGRLAQVFLSVMVSGGPVSCTLKLAEPALWHCLTVQGSDLGSLLVQVGLAYAAGPAYQFEQARARAAGLGLWRAEAERPVERH